MSHLSIRPFHPNDTEKVIAIWKQCGLTRDWNNPYLDIERKLSCQSDLFLVGEVESDIVATAMFGFDGHRGWLNYFAVRPEFQKRGFGRDLLEFGEQKLIAIGCPKLNLQVRAENVDALQYYRHLGYAEDNAVSLGKRLIED